MGAGTSSAARDGAGGPVRPSRLAGLRATGRYFELPATGGGVVRVLGVCPSSTRCEEEAFDLVASTQPSHVYIDLPREWTDALLADVRAQRVGDWKIPDTTPPFRLVPGAGVLGSVLVRNALADNEMLGLMGGEAYGPYKAALAAGEALRRGDGSADGDGGGGGSEGSASTASAAAAAAGGGAGAQPAYVSYPFPMAYNGGAMLDRPSHVATFLLGDNSFGSTTVFAMIGNSVAIMAGEPGLAEFAAALPPDAGYFTRDGVTKLRRDFRAAVNAAVARVTADTADLEADLTRREEAARAAGDAAGAAAFEASVVKSQVQVRSPADGQCGSRRSCGASRQRRRVAWWGDGTCAGGGRCIRGCIASSAHPPHDSGCAARL